LKQQVARASASHFTFTAELVVHELEVMDYFTNKVILIVTNTYQIVIPILIVIIIVIIINTILLLQ